MNNWKEINFTEVDTPALIIDPKKVKHNIKLAIDYAGGVDRFRPHVKTHKILEVARLQVAAGIYKFKCATIAEAEMLGMAKAKDVLIAYPVQGPKIKRVLSLIDMFPETKFRVLIDNALSAKAINDAFKAANQSAEVFIDINNGHFRTGIIIENVPSLVEACKDFTNLKIIGIHCYDGHIRMPAFDERETMCKNAFEAVLQMRKVLEKSLDHSLAIVAGGSPSFSVHTKHHDVECSPGTFVFWDQRYGDEYREQRFEKAAIVATRVISKLDAHTYCLDLGHKSIASEFPFPRVSFLHHGEFTQIGHSEEHLIIKSAKADALNPGQLLLGYPYHICPTVALYDHVHVAQAGQLTDQWRVIARDRKITI